MTERSQQDTELFLGRVDEQQRFRNLLNTLPKPRRWNSFLRRSTSTPEWSYIVLIHGVGGIGKSTLSRRARHDKWSPARPAIPRQVQSTLA
jgi:hypothetical protein